MANTTDIMDKIQKLRQEKPHLRISFVSGLFKILHVGHIRLLRFAKETSDILVVGILPEVKSQNTLQIYKDRLEAIQSVVSVDFADIIMDLENFLKELKPDFVVKGKEHEENFNLEQNILDEYGGRILFTGGFSTPSYTDIPKYTEHADLNLRFPKDFYERHNLHNDSLIQYVKKYQDLNVIVIGDTIVDEYINCDPVGMSQEDPTIVVTPIASNKYIGGAGIVAAHAAGLGAKVRFFSVCGNDDTAQYAREKLKKYQIEEYLFTDKSRPTSLKQRFKCKSKTMLRVSHLRQHSISHEIANNMMNQIKKFLPQTDVLIFSDFNYGCLPQFIVNQLIECARKFNVTITADSQSSSQVGDVSRFTNTALLTPTEREARLATKDFESGLVVLANKLMEKANAQNIVITLGEAGLLIQSQITDQIPALNPIAVDTAGAGDSFLVATSLALATKANIWEAVSLGSIAAAVQVSREGNIPLSKEIVINHILHWKNTNS